MTKPRVSVIMASYNHAPFVQQCLDSVLTQSFSDVEFVITDDGSKDATAEVIAASPDPRVKLNRLATNAGACMAANDAIARAQGEYIAVLNSDDYFLPGKLERQVRFLDENPGIGGVFGRPRFVDERGAPYYNPTHAFARIFETENRGRLEWLRYFFEVGNCLCHPTLLIRRSCYEKVGVFDPLLMQLPDLDIWVRLCREFEIHILPEELTAMRILDRERNTSAPSREKVARCAWEMASILRHYEALSDADLRLLFPGTTHGDRPAKVILALEAIATERPGYVQFGLGLLERMIREHAPAVSYPEYFRLVGQADPFSVELQGKEYRLIRDTGLPSLARRVVRWGRTLNFKR